MKYAFLTDDLKTLAKIKTPDILYFGSEFCVNMMPDIKTLEKALKFSLKRKTGFVLVLPFISNDKIKQADKLLAFLSRHKKRAEVIFNDWGALLLILKYKNLEPVAGRLLTKQRKDPAAFDIIENKQRKMKITVINGRQTILESKKIPATLKEYFQKSFIDAPGVSEFMAENKIKRCELDLLPWSIKIKKSKKIKLSVYFPYANITVTRYCGAINLNYSNRCARLCASRITEVGAGRLKYPYIIKGNAVFYRTGIEMLGKAVLQNKNIDRIVFNDAESFNKHNTII